MAIETIGYDLETVKSLLEILICPVKWCREILTLTNRVTCKNCGLKVCLKDRFKDDDACNKKTNSANADQRLNEKFMEALALRDGKGCVRRSSVSTSPTVCKNIFHGNLLKISAQSQILLYPCNHLQKTIFILKYLSEREIVVQKNEEDDWVSMYRLHWWNIFLPESVLTC